jgi:signal transduction histidine kinase
LLPSKTGGFFLATRFEQPENRRGARAEYRQKGGGPAPPAADFEELLSDLSAALIRVSVDQLDNEMERWLERIVVAMGIDRGTIAQVDRNDGVLYISHQWARRGLIANEHGLRTPDARHLFPWLMEKLLAGEPVVISRIDDLPAEATVDKQYFLRTRNKSNVTLPVKVGDTAVGVLSFSAIRFEKHWSEQDVQRFELVAEIFGNALERKRAEAEIRRLSEELRRASQVMTMGELTASLAHELNQPLGAILNNAKAARRLLGAKTPDVAEVEAALDDIIRDDARAVDIIKSVRALFQRSEEKVETVDIRQLLLDVAGIVGSDARTKEISWSVEVPDVVPLVRGHKTHLTQAVLNLVVNAFESVCDDEGPREVILCARREDPSVIHISVRDSGKGIDPNVMRRLFDPFFTTKPTGMGMGLTIVRSIVESHGGRIWATPNPDRGATFAFVLPVESMSR